MRREKGNHHTVRNGAPVPCTQHAKLRATHSPTHLLRRNCPHSFRGIPMEASTGKRASPNWHALYEAAVLEIDLNKLPHRIAEAQDAIMDRIEDLNHSCDGSERRALIDALNVLRDLRKMADADSLQE